MSESFKTKQPPSTSRNVHFIYGDQHLAAIITDPAIAVDHEPGVPHIQQALVVFPPLESSFTTVAIEDPTGQQPGTWHFPEFVPPVSA